MGLFFGSGFFGYPYSGTGGESVVTTFDPTGDFELVADGQETITLIDRAGAEYVRDHVLRRMIQRNEVWKSNGFYKAGDTVFNFSTTEQQGEPGLGWRIVTDDFNTFTILGCGRHTLGDRWRAVARNLDVEYNLSNEITVLKKTKTRGPTGAIAIGWVAEEIDVRARIQTQEAVRTVENGRTVYKESALCVFLTQREIDGDWLIKDSQQRYWKIVKITNKDRIDVLFELELERSPWPMS